MSQSNQSSQSKSRKECISSMISTKSGAYLLSMKSIGGNLHSNVWNYFSRIKFSLPEVDLSNKGIGFKTLDLDGECVLISDSYVACNTCFRLFTHETNSSGTSSLLHHSKRCNPDLSQQNEKIDTYIELRTRKLTTIDKEIRRLNH